MRRAYAPLRKADDAVLVDTTGKAGRRCCGLYFEASPEGVFCSSGKICFGLIYPGIVLTSKCKCGPVVQPVIPTVPKTESLVTPSPTLTLTVFKWA